MENYELYIKTIALVVITSFFIWHALAGVMSGVKKVTKYIPLSIVVLLTAYEPKVFMVVVAFVASAVILYIFTSWIQAKSNVAPKESLSIFGLLGLCVFGAISVVNYQSYEQLFYLSPFFILILGVTVYYLRGVYLKVKGRERFPQYNIFAKSHVDTTEFESELRALKDEVKINFFTKHYFDQQYYFTKQLNLILGSTSALFIALAVYIFIQIRDEELISLPPILMVFMLIFTLLISKYSARWFFAKPQYKLWPETLYREFREFTYNRIRKFSFKMSVRQVVHHFLTPSVNDCEYIHGQVSYARNVTMNKTAMVRNYSPYEITDVYLKDVLVYRQILRDNYLTETPEQRLEHYAPEYQIIDMKAFGKLVNFINNEHKQGVL